MTLENERRTIAVFAECSDAQLALQELKASNFPMHNVSVIARNAEEQSDIAGVEVKERTGNISSKNADRAVIGSTLGGLTGLLVGLVLWVIPGIGRVILAGAKATAIATTLVGGLPGILLSLGIPKEQAQGYSDLVCKGYYLVIVTGIDIEIRLAKRIFNRRDLQQWGVYQPYSTPNSRYKQAVGVFYTRQDAQRALTELRSAGFPMSQVSIVAKNISNLSDIFEVNISSSQDNYTTLGIPDELAKYYEHQVSLSHYVVVIKATDIYIAGARAILESNNIQHFSIYSQSELDAARSDRQITTNF
ncbi:MAG: general stress protein [Nostoc sp.]|uniref:general stress protein n=1 Tax=Nostoc sp. TaxID=1180 RepID=UPI002FEFF477